MNDERFAAVILAAGSSSRFLRQSSPHMSGIKKEFIKIDDNGLTALGSSVKTFASIPSVKIIVIAVRENEEEAGRGALPPELQKTLEDKKIIFVNGGKTRSASVFNALSALTPYNPCYVLIHDGARPWVSASLINGIIDAVKRHGAVIPLLPLTDTPKEITYDKEQRTDNDAQSAVFIKRHLKRNNVGAAQTPQAFRFPEILRAYEKAAEAPGEDFTDDAEIWGRFGGCGASGGEVAVIPGEKENRKITFPEDIF